MNSNNGPLESLKSFRHQGWSSISEKPLVRATIVLDLAVWIGCFSVVGSPIGMRFRIRTNLRISYGESGMSARNPSHVGERLTCYPAGYQRVHPTLHKRLGYDDGSGCFWQFSGLKLVLIRRRRLYPPAGRYPYLLEYSQASPLEVFQCPSM